MLRGKTAQVSADHNREVRALGAVRERAQRVGDRVRAQEEQFWREISRVARAQKGGGSSQPGRPDLNLSRALDAHKLLSRVKQEQKSVSQEVTAGVARVISSKVALSAFKKMERQEARRHQFRFLERQGEEIGELATSARATLVRRRSEPCDDSASQEVGCSLRAGFASCPPTILRVYDTTTEPSSSPAVSVPAQDISIQSAMLSHERHESSLRVQIESRGVPVACTLSSKATGGVSVIVETPHQGILARVERERDTLAAKLSAMGIRIGRLDIKRGDTMSDAHAGHIPRRRRSREERDENVIA